MASSVTHAYFMLDVYDRLDIDIKKFLIDEKPLLKVAAQGMDPFFFYRILNPRRGRRIREFGNFFHENYTRDYFETLINYIKYNGYACKSDVMAFLYGTISHYILDSTIHPFVVYKTGVFDSKNKNTYPYNMLHEEVESMYDAYFISLREHILPRKFKSYQFCFEKVDFSSTLEEVINFTFSEVFDTRNMTKFYKRALSDIRFFFYVFRYDRYGLKRRFYKIVDFVSPRSFRRKTPLSYDLKIDYSFFNLEHSTWYNPTSKKIKSNSSVLELYTSSLDSCVKTIRKVNDYIYNDVGDLKDILKNVSYVTGIDIDKKQEIKYFEF